MSTLRPVEDLTYWIGGKPYKFTPPTFVEPDDMMRLVQLFVAGVVQGRVGELDLEDFVTRRHLWCYFTAIE